MNTFLAAPKKLQSPITIIGMAGAGKTTVGKALADALNWAFADTDYLIEGAYGTCLQNVADAMSKEEFLDVEAEQIGKILLNRTVIATGGSVVYRDAAMQHLKALGPIVYIDVPLGLILERIARNPNRGLAIAPGQTIEDLFQERIALYQKYADITVAAEKLTPAECAEYILKQLPATFFINEQE